jgi:hypothetical protein
MMRAKGESMTQEERLAAAIAVIEELGYKVVSREMPHEFRGVWLHDNGVVNHHDEWEMLLDALPVSPLSDAKE